MSVLEAIRLRRRPSSAWATRHLPMRLHHWRGVARRNVTLFSAYRHATPHARVVGVSPIGCTLVPRSLIITNWLDWEESIVKKSSTKTGKSQRPSQAARSEAFHWTLLSGGRSGHLEGWSGRPLLTTPGRAAV